MLCCTAVVLIAVPLFRVFFLHFVPAGNESKLTQEEEGEKNDVQ